VAPTVAVTHRTSYAYDRPVPLGPHVIRLRPAPHTRTPVLAYDLQVQPAAHVLRWQQDPFGNHQARVLFAEPVERLDLVVDLVLDMAAINPFDFFVEASADRAGFAYEPGLRLDLAPYLETLPPGPHMAAWLEARARPLLDAGAGGGEPLRTIDLLVELTRRVLADVAYSTRMDPGVLTPDETLEQALASCRDTGWLLVQALRHVGLAARFVSGYLVQLAAADAPAGGSGGPAADRIDLHAWAEAYVPGAGWIGVDPTSGLLAGEGHIPLACTREPRSAAPVEGTVGAAEARLEHEHRVVRVHVDAPPR
jgi:transglutaminase-like putative cysteine protease